MICDQVVPLGHQNDDRSESSTQSTNNSGPDKPNPIYIDRKPKDPQRSCPQRVDKSVRFRNQEVFCRSDHHYSVDELKSLGLWYRKEDYEEFRKRTLAMADNVRRFESSFAGLMEALLVICIELGNKDEKTNKLVLSNDAFHYLKKRAASLCITPGMERLIIEPLKIDCHRRRDDIVQAVFDLQEEMEGASIQEKEEAIRMKCESISQPSRLYASVIAEVQMLA